MKNKVDGYHCAVCRDQALATQRAERTKERAFCAETAQQQNAAMLARQQEIMGAIAKEKGELKPYLDQWEALQPEVRAKLRAGRPGEILEALETVAQGIQARHQEMFGADDPASATGAAPTGASGKQAGGDPAKTEKQPDLSQMINIYRALQ